MKKITLIYLSLLASASAYSSVDETSESNVNVRENRAYLGMTLGSTTSGVAKDFNGVCIGECIDDNSSNFGLLFGYDFNSVFAVEGSFNTARGHDYDFYIVSDNTYRVKGELSHDTYAIALKGTIPDLGNFRPYGKLGLASTTTDDGWDSQTNTGIQIGIGADYAISNDFSIRGGLESAPGKFFGLDGGINTFSLGLMIHL